VEIFKEVSLSKFCTSFLLPRFTDCHTSQKFVVQNSPYTSGTNSYKTSSCRQVSLTGSSNNECD